MKAIILAAGKGTRLRPHTEDKPKCMVEFQNKPIIDSILENIIEQNIKDISIITGYKNEVLKSYITEKYENNNINIYENVNYHKTNMVSTLFNARNELNDDVIISYSDIIYKKDILDELTNSEDDITVVVDKEWRKLWELRMDNPLEDAETLKLNSNGDILELGKKPGSYDDIEGQYIGLIKISKDKISKVIDFYDNLPKNKVYDGKDFENMYMTTFIQLLIDNGFKVSSLIINGGWLEIDSVEDLHNLKSYKI